MYGREEGHISQWGQLVLGELRNVHRPEERIERGVRDSAP